MSARVTAAATKGTAEQPTPNTTCPGHVWREHRAFLGRWAECTRCGAEEDR